MNLFQLAPKYCQIFLKEWAIPGLFFFIFVFSIQMTVNIQYKFLLVTGFEPRTSGIGSDCSTNWATTTANAIVWWLTKVYDKSKSLPLLRQRTVKYCLLKRITLSSKGHRLHVIFKLVATNFTDIGIVPILHHLSSLRIIFSLDLKNEYRIALAYINVTPYPVIIYQIM